MISRCCRASVFELLSSLGVIIIIIIITTTRYDKLYIDNEPYVWDEEENRVLPARFFIHFELEDFFFKQCNKTILQMCLS